MLKRVHLAIPTLLFCGITSAENYPQFRGENADATATVALPIEWSDLGGEQRNVAWKTQVPGEGWSQPIVWSDRLFLTAAVPSDPADNDKVGPEIHRGGYGRDRDDLVNVSYKYQVLCLSVQNGQILWRCTVKDGKPPIPRHSTNTYATETPITDGNRVYAYFGMNGVHCLDLDGNLIWQRDLGAYEMRAGWGTSSSPVLFNDRLFIQVDNEVQSFLIALDSKTGNVVWRVDRDERSQYSSPFIWRNSLRSELILGGMVYRARDPATGKLLWKIDMDKGRSSATPVAVGDALFIGNEFRNRGGSDDGGGRLYCITPGGHGDITPPSDEMAGPFVKWRMDDSGIQMASPLHCQGKLYFFQRRAGIVTCVDASSGEKIYESRVRGAKAFWASPWTDGQHVYALDSGGATHVLKPTAKLETVSVNEMDDPVAWSTPAIADGKIFLRTVDHLYCIDEGQGEG